MNQNLSNHSTATKKYTERLNDLESIWWKKLLDVQAPYRWNLKRLKLGRVLDVGCGIGRNLSHLSSNSVGVDTNPHSVKVCTERGLQAITTSDLNQFKHDKSFIFDTLLFAHVIEHMSALDAEDLIKDYLPYLKTGGFVVLICPQKAGYQSDATHIEYYDDVKMNCLLRKLKIKNVRSYSFPFPEMVGKFFKYNEYVVLGKKIEQ
jgi:2-polyprenyl-3-methyl-5-hydroxy-6-metoxy-1,4-benzoquinol methylase